MKHHSLDYYRSRLRVNKNQLDDELEDQAEMLEQISMAVALHNTTMLEAKEGLQRIEASLADDYRDREAKMTAAAVDSAVKQHRERISALRLWMDARETLEQWQGLEKAWKDRGYAMSTLSALYSQQYFALRSTTATQRTSRDRAYEEGRERLRDASPPPSRRRVVE